MDDLVYHFSDDPDITRFDPRPAPRPGPGSEGKMVWAVGSTLMHNFLLPRDCPRITFFALPESEPCDVERLMGWSTATYVVAIETRWLKAVQSQTLYRYDLPKSDFMPYKHAAGADFYISRQSVVPLKMTVLDDLLGALTACDVELRVMPSLWELREKVIASTLQFSIIRMRNAQPPVNGYEAYHPL